jgi:hypothetical protein
MSKTIEFGAFVASATADRLRAAQQVASRLGVQVASTGSRFAGTGQSGDPIKVVVTVPSETVLTPEVVAQGRDAFDELLNPGERLTDYALVKDNGSLVEVVSLLTAESRNLAQRVASAAAPAAPAAPARPRRWSPFGR